MPHTHHAAFESSLFSAALIVAALVYLRGWARVRCVDVDLIAGWRAASSLCGLFLIWIAVASPVAALDHELLTVHMVQHLLLMTLAPPLLWLGAPMKPLLQGLPQRCARVIRSWFSSAALQRLGKAISRPAVCWLAAAGTLVGWHVPDAFMLGMRSGVWHGIEQASFLGTGFLFWWPVVRSNSTASTWREWSILLYLFFATLPCDILSGFLVFCDRVVYPVNFSALRPLGFSALEDQQCAGALMWSCVTVVYLIAGTIYAMRLLAPECSRQRSVLRSYSQLGRATQRIEVI